MLLLFVCLRHQQQQQPRRSANDMETEHAPGTPNARHDYLKCKNTSPRNTQQRVGEQSFAHAAPVMEEKNPRWGGAVILKERCRQSVSCLASIPMHDNLHIFVLMRCSEPCAEMLARRCRKRVPTAGCDESCSARTEIKSLSGRNMFRDVV